MQNKSKIKISNFLTHIIGHTTWTTSYIHSPATDKYSFVVAIDNAEYSTQLKSTQRLLPLPEIHRPLKQTEQFSKQVSKVSKEVSKYLRAMRSTILFVETQRQSWR